jgi:hypothetical protein
VGCEDRKGGEHDARSSTTVHGEPNQGSDSVTIVKRKSSQVSGMGSGDKGDPFGPEGPTQIPICQHMRGNLCQMVRV